MLVTNEFNKFLFVSWLLAMIICETFTDICGTWISGVQHTCSHQRIFLILYFFHFVVVVVVLLLFLSVFFFVFVFFSNPSGSLH